MSDKIKLTKLALETSTGTKVELSIDEAKDLYDELHSLFGQNTVYIPSTPIVVERDRWLPPHRPYFYSETTLDSPKIGGLDVQCKTLSDNGLRVSYCG